LNGKVSVRERESLFLFSTLLYLSFLQERGVCRSIDQNYVISLVISFFVLLAPLPPTKCVFIFTDLFVSKNQKWELREFFLRGVFECPERQLRFF